MVRNTKIIWEELIMQEITSNEKTLGYYTDTAFNGIVSWDINPITQEVIYRWMQFPSEQDYLEYVEGK